MAAFTFESRLPGSWERDFGHFPDPLSPMISAVFPAPFAEGFADTCARYGVPIHGMQVQVINGILFGTMSPLGADGGADFDLMTELHRRQEAAAAAFATRPWRIELAEWDHTRKPASLRAHRALGEVDLGTLSDDGLRTHVSTCIGHHEDMTRQHHVHNMAAMIPVGDFVAHVAAWTGRKAEAIVPVFEGFSPLSGVWSGEIAQAAEAVAADNAAQALLAGSDDAGKRLLELGERVPEVAEYVRNVDYRIVDGFDILNPTLREMPALVIGKLASAVALGGPQPTEMAERRAEELRDDVPADERGTFDDLLAEARHVYRLRDERGVFSDMSSAGLLRLALLELGRRMAADGRVHEPDHALHLTPDEAVRSAGREHAVTADDLARRVEALAEVALVDVPRMIGDPPSPPPRPDALPAPLARVMRAITALGLRAPEQETTAPEGTLLGVCGHPGRYEGTARVVSSVPDLLRVEPGDVLVAKTTSEAFNAAIFLAGALVTDFGGVSSHGAIVAREVGIPAVVGTETATVTISDGDRVVVDAEAGTVTVVR